MSFQKLDLNNRVRPGGRNVVMLYGFEGFEMEKLAGSVLTSGIDEWIYIDFARENMIISEIIEYIRDNQGVSFTKKKDQVILFNGTSQYELQQFVSAAYGYLKDKPLVAMVTPVSKEWKFGALVSELKQERQELAKNRK